jgi:multisubunit Na+/H+ antiporter MnhC subunit
MIHQKLQTANHKRITMRQSFIKTLSLLLSGLLLVTATVGKSFSIKQKPQKKSKTEQTTKGKSQKAEKPVVQQLSLEAVVSPAATFDFVPSFCLLPPPVMTELPMLSIHRQFDIFYYFFSYFRNVFGHHIATNAP